MTIWSLLPSHLCEKHAAEPCRVFLIGTRQSLPMLSWRSPVHGKRVAACAQSRSPAHRQNLKFFMCLRQHMTKPPDTLASRRRYHIFLCPCYRIQHTTNVRRPGYTTKRVCRSSVRRHMATTSPCAKTLFAVYFAHIAKNPFSLVYVYTYTPLIYTNIYNVCIVKLALVHL
jgi:hypothetical protein